jgi:hypothetical protein
MSAMKENLLKVHKCTLKKENQSEKRSFGKKNDLREKVGPIDAQR